MSPDWYAAETDRGVSMKTTDLKDTDKLSSARSREEKDSCSTGKTNKSCSRVRTFMRHLLLASSDTARMRVELYFCLGE